MTTQNKFNTTINGTTVVDVNSVMNLSTTLIVDPAKTPYIDNIILFNPSINTFILKPGNYKLVNLLQIRKDGIRIVGLTGLAKDVQIKQTLNFDGILIQANNIVLQDISIKCTFSGRSCLIAASANNTLVTGCNFYGCDDHFSIYYAGPSTLLAGQSTLTAYANYNLDTGNIFYKNIVYTDFSGDSVSFSLQYKSQFIGNFVRGGKISVYMCRTTNIYNNIITDSNSNGIYVSFPTDNISIIGNNIYNASYSGLVMKNQMEHGTFASYNYNVIVQNNTIFNCKMYGIELNNANGVIIVNNSLSSGETIGIYSYGGSNLSVKGNKIAYFNYAIYLENTSNSTITSNNLMSVYPVLGQNAIKVINSSTANTIISNNIYGQYVYDLISNGGINTTISNNPIVPYYTMNDERSIYNVM